MKTTTSARSGTWKIGDPNRMSAIGADAELAVAKLGMRDQLRYIRDANDNACYRLAKWIRGAVMGDPDSARYCRDHGFAMEKAQVEDINQPGGYLVPEALAQPIIDMRECFGVVRRNARLWPLRFGGNSSVPRRASGAVAAWTSEGGSLSETSNTYDSAALTMRKLSAMIKASTEIEEDALAAWGEFLAEEFGWALAVAEDNAAFVGDGTSTFGKIVGIQSGLTARNSAGKITAAAGHNTFGALDATDIGSLLGALPARALPNARLYVSVSGYGNALARIGGTNGGLVASVDSTGAVSANYQGFPIQFVPSLPSSTANLSGKMLMVAGDLKQGVALGERRLIVIRRLAERFADFDQIAMTVTERVDINAHDIGDANGAGALVGLFAP